MSFLGSILSKTALSGIATRAGKFLPAVAVTLGLGLITAGPAMAQHHGGGGGGFHGGGGGGFHGGGFHGGGFHGGGFHGGGFRGGFYGRGFYGFGGFYPGFYPGFGFGYDAFDPYWFDYESAPYYGYDTAYGYGPQAYGQPYGPQSYPQTYQQQQQYYPPSGAESGIPTDNSRGFYRWQTGVESGSCNRPYVQQVTAGLTGVQATGLKSGAQLGGISVQHVIGGRIGPRLDITDQVCATQALEHTATGTPVRWQTASGIPVTFTVTRTEDGQGRQSCRDYEATAQFASHTDTVRNTACKGPDGSWRVTR